MTAYPTSFFVVLQPPYFSTAHGQPPPPPLTINTYENTLSCSVHWLLCKTLVRMALSFSFHTFEKQNPVWSTVLLKIVSTSWTTPFSSGSLCKIHCASPPGRARQILYRGRDNIIILGHHVGGFLRHPPRTTVTHISTHSVRVMDAVLLSEARKDRTYMKLRLR